LQRLRADLELAEIINGELSDESRRQNGLWRLAGASESVKGNVVSLLARTSSEPSNLDLLPEISRALGLLRPSPSEASSLVGSAVNNLSDGLVPTLEVLAPRLTAAQVKFMFDHALVAGDKGSPLWQDLAALAPKLTDTAADGALDPVLKLISQTTSIQDRDGMAKVIATLAPKLIDARVNQSRCH
jgi:hypothetical protein